MSHSKKWKHKSIEKKLQNDIKQKEPPVHFRVCERSYRDIIRKVIQPQKIHGGTQGNVQRT